MWFTSLLSTPNSSARRHLSQRSGSRTPKRTGLRSPAKFAPRLDELGERTLPSTFSVTSPSDDGSSGTLRSVLAHAGDGDVITFANRLRGDTIHLTQGELRVAADVTITGPGADRLSVSGSGRSRVFEVMGGATATISGLTVRDGFATQGGGIAVDAGGELTLANDVLTRNNGNGMGGAVYNAGAAAIDGCLLTANVGMTGSLDLNHQTLSNAFDMGAGGMSGAADPAGGLMGMGGAVDNAGTMSISHSTLTGNTALIGSVSINQSTITNAFAMSMSGSGGMGGGGGGMGGGTGGMGGGTGGMGGMMGMGNGVLGLMGMGGAIHNEGTLVVQQSSLSGNTAVEGSITINHSSITNTFDLTDMNTGGMGGGGGGMGGGTGGMGGGTGGMGGMMGMGNGVLGLMGMGGGIANMGTLAAEGSTLSGNVGADGSVTINHSTLTNTISMPDMSGMGGGGGMSGGGTSGGGMTGGTGDMTGMMGMMGAGNGTAAVMGMGGGIANMGTLATNGGAVTGNTAVVGSVGINHSTLSVAFSMPDMGGMSGGMTGGTGGGMSGMTMGMGVGNGLGGIMAMGGGIANGGTLTPRGTTVSGNHALQGSVRVNHSTLTSNGGDTMGTGIGQGVGMDDDVHNMGTIN
jgi:hypothetical protein